MKPKVQAIQFADHVYKDEFTGKYIVSGIHNTYLLNPNAKPDRAPEDGSAAIPMDMHRAGAPYAYVNLTEFNGKFDFELLAASLAFNQVGKSSNLLGLTLTSGVSSFTPVPRETSVNRCECSRGEGDHLFPQTKPK